MIQKTALAALMLTLSYGCGASSPFTSSAETEGETDSATDTSSTGIDTSETQTSAKTPVDSSGQAGDIEIIFATHIGNPGKPKDPGTDGAPQNLTHDPSQYNLISDDDDPGLEVDSDVFVTKATLQIAQIQLFHDKTSKSAEPGATWEGPFDFDALASAIDPQPPSTSVADGTYKRLEFTVSTSEDALITGVYENKEDEMIVFEVRPENSLALKITGDKGIKIEPGSTNRIQVRVDIEEWFEKIELEDATVDSSGVAILSPTQNSAMLAKFEQNFAMSQSFGKDDDDDDLLDDDEIGGQGELDDDDDDDDESDHDSSDNSGSGSDSDSRDDNNSGSGS